ncbi:MAG: DNA mismatch repair endonuclease MutL [Deltaproteobacteria bacterium]|nr:DNA mismatch repair endonuclease MutL [Deltaproteobacteria bacterium]
MMESRVSAEIRLLPPEVCNQIAAGEVVERPASVVKELVENALDAGADQVRVVIENGGKKLIEVIDNGHGMDPASARLALERHATSKIRSAADLFGVASYGFRGEALPSIAAVSRFTLISRCQEMEAAVKLEIEGGGPVRESRVGAPLGTRVAVADLFFPVPARKKFLKTTNTERSAVLDRMQRFAMAHPEVSFILEHNGRKLFKMTSGDREEDRVATILGLNADTELRRLETASDSGIELKGYVSLPRVQRSSSRHIYFFVNRRAVRDKALLQALLKAYEGLLPRGRYPAAVIFLTVPAGVVDVNVHPAKEEVRFAESGRLFSLIRRLAGESLSGYPATVEDFFMPAGGTSGVRVGMSDPAAADEASSLPPDFYEPPAPHHPAKRSGDDFSGPARRNPPRVSELAAGPQTSGPALDFGLKESASRSLSGFSPEDESPVRGLPGMGSSGRGFFSSMTIIGSLWDSYIVLQAHGQCYLLDQHAAHERVLFEELKKRKRGALQRLLLPVTVECTPLEVAQAEEFQEPLLELGFEFEFLGPHSLLLHTLPMAVAGVDAEMVFLETLNDLVAGGEGLSGAVLDELLARMACRLAVKANRSLDRDEIRNLLLRLDQTPHAHTCPHGRPFYFTLAREEIEKRFQR